MRETELRAGARGVLFHRPELGLTAGNQRVPVDLEDLRRTLAPSGYFVAGSFAAAMPFVFHLNTTNVSGVVPVFLIPWTSQGAV